MKVDRLGVGVSSVPTGEPESDGTFTWTQTTVVTARPRAGDETGLGSSYATGACATLIREVLAEVVVGADPMDVPGIWAGMVGAIRNLGRPGIASMAIAAVDTALWDLKAHLLGQPLCRLLGMVRDLCPADVAAGEYGYDLSYFRRMVAAGAVDCLQADVSRCARITEWLRVAALAAASKLELSAHCAQSLTAHVACADHAADHARVDRLLFDGVLDPAGGVLRPDLSRPGTGLDLEEADAERYRERPDG